LQPSRDDVVLRRKPNAKLKGSKKLSNADSNQLSKLFSCNSLGQVLLDVIDDPI
jgi:hypothetical protein